MRACFLFAVFAASVAHGNLIVNGSFESGGFVPNGQNTMSLPVGSTVMTGWTVFNDTVAWISDPNPFGGIYASDGIRSLDLADYATGGPYAGLAQSFSTTPGARYRVRFDLGTHNGWTSSASILVAAAGASQEFSSVSSVGQRWDTYTWEFTATASSTNLTLLGTYNTYTYIGLDNVVVEPAGPTLSGNVELQNFDGLVAGHVIEVEATGGVTASGTAVLDNAGNFSLPLSVPNGQYTVAIKASHWLRKAVLNVSITAAGPNNVSVSLNNGDIDGDNEIAIGDYSILSAAYNSSPGDANWVAASDLNGDDAVDIVDYAILSANYGLFGD
ncbi:MAG: DUF642 domain-containing protein [Fimbriimonadaceae bacterium]|nr:DUF642 domain-containing protein [Fimbriimonadaceae bacterium]